MTGSACKTFKSILLFAAALSLAGAANAANLADFPPNETSLSWKAKWAESSAFNSNGGHAFWNLLDEGEGNEIWWFTPEGSGVFDEGPDPTGVAKLTGRIQRRVGGSYVGDVYEVDINFAVLENYTEALADGHNPKLELSSSAYVAPFGTGTGASIDPRTWRYYHLTDGTVTNVSGAGDFFVLAQAPTSLNFVTQVGVGANNKNLNMGLATWFTSKHFNAAGDELGFQDQGDININLTRMVPLPAAAWAGLPVLAGLGALKRRNA